MATRNDTFLRVWGQYLINSNRTGVGQALTIYQLIDVRQAVGITFNNLGVTTENQSRGELPGVIFGHSSSYYAFFLPFLAEQVHPFLSIPQTKPSAPLS